ncbi:MAG: hypothetical protein ACLP7J_22880 [Streptosporangiaceae bacterium]
MDLQRADADQYSAIIRLIDEASAWLRTKVTDQWARPWPNRAGRDSEILAWLREGKTWIGWDDDVPAATLTPDPGEDPYWADDSPAEPAIYLPDQACSSRPADLAGPAEEPLPQ